MIQRKPSNRLGREGTLEVKEHPWLKSFPWERLLKKDLPSPYVPSVIFFIILISKYFFLFSQKKIISMQNNRSVSKIAQMKILSNKMHFY